VRRAAAGDNAAAALDHVLHEVQAARHDLNMTRFCLQQSEALRRIDRAAARLADLMQSQDRKNKQSRACEPLSG